MLKSNVASNLLWQINSSRQKAGKSLQLLRKAGYRVDINEDGRYVSPGGPEAILAEINFMVTVMGRVAEVLERHGYTLDVTLEGNYKLRVKTEVCDG